MRHLTPYGRAGQRFREVDPQEMDSLMSADAPGTLPDTRLRAIRAAIVEAFPRTRRNPRILYFRLHPPLSTDTFTRATNLCSGQANNINIFHPTAAISRMDIIYSVDDFFYVTVFYTSHHQKARGASSLGDWPFGHSYVVCDGMRGLLNLIGALGRGDELDTHTKHP